MFRAGTHFSCGGLRRGQPARASHFRCLRSGGREGENPPCSFQERSGSFPRAALGRRRERAKNFHLLQQAEYMPQFFPKYRRWYPDRRTGPQGNNTERGCSGKRRSGRGEASARQAVCVTVPDSRKGRCG